MIGNMVSPQCMAGQHLTCPAKACPCPCHRPKVVAK